MDIATVKIDLRNIADTRGGRMFGACRADELRDDFHFEIKKASEKLNTAISVGVPVSPAVLDTIIDRPNMLYKAHYQQINHILNDIAFAISSYILGLGKNRLKSIA